MAGRDSLALILEDTDLGRWALTRALEAVGYEVHAPWTWAEASEWMHRATFRLALVAVSSPDHAADIVADARPYRQMHLVLLADEDIVDDVRRACGDEPVILAKPLDLAQVSEIALSSLDPGREARRA